MNDSTLFLLDLAEKTLQCQYDKLQLNQLAIVVSPHLDDESIGMGGTIAKLIDFGFCVYIIYITAEKLDKKKGTDPYKRKVEAFAALASLGIKSIENIHFLDFEDGNMKKISLNYPKSAGLLQTKINQIEIQNKVIDSSGKNLVQAHTLILTTSRFDGHRDHEETFNLIKNATRKRIILEFPTVNHIASYFSSNCIIDISAYFSAKKNALEKYRGEIKKNRILWEDIFKLDEQTGKKINVSYAESCFVSWYGLLPN